MSFYSAWLLRPPSWSFLTIEKSSNKLTLFLALVLLQRRTLHNEQYMILMTCWHLGLLSESDLRPILLVPIEYRQEAVRLFSSSGSWMNMNPASRVLRYSRTNDPHTSWIAYSENGDKEQWFVLDLSAKMSFDAVRIANCKDFSDNTNGFRWVQTNCIKLLHSYW